MAQRALKAAVAVVAMACGVALTNCGGSSPPAAPEPSPVPSVTTLSLQHPTATIFIGSTEQFDARETLTDGTTRAAVNPAWTSDKPAVATISASGLLTAVAAGEAVISAEANGRRGTASIRVFPSFSGAWIGSERVTDCRDSGDFAGACAELAIVDVVGAHASTFTQDAAAVTAVIDGGDELSVRTSGTVTVDGELRLNAAPVLPAEPGLTLQLENWRCRSDVPSRMNGSYDLVLTADGFQGSVRFAIQLQDVTRAGASTAGARPRAALLTPAIRQRLLKLRRE